MNMLRHLPLIALLTGLPAQDALSPAFESYVAHIAAAEGALRHGATAAVRRWLDAVPANERAFEWRWLDAEAEQSVRTLPLHDGTKILAIAVAPDGHTFATGGVDGSVRLWRMPDGAADGVLQAHDNGSNCRRLTGRDAPGQRRRRRSAGDVGRRAARRGVDP